MSEYENEILGFEQEGKSDIAEMRRGKLELILRQEYQLDPSRWARIPAWAEERAGVPEEDALRWGSKAWFFNEGDSAEGAPACDDEGDDLEDAPTGDHGSTRVVRTFGSVFLEPAVRGFAAGVSALELETGGGSSSSGGAKYENGHAIRHDSGAVFGTIVHYLGAGAMGFVYKLDYELPAAGRKGAIVQCALKTVRSTATAKEKHGLEKALASEVAIGFACGRAVGIASVIDALIPTPGVHTGASEGLMLVCDLVDGGDLEEGMHSGAKKNGRLVEDYTGVLYSIEGMKVWPLISIMLQIFKAFEHIHDRGIIHQVPCMSLWHHFFCTTIVHMPSVVSCTV